MVHSQYLPEKSIGRDIEPCSFHSAGEHVNMKSVLHNLLKVNNTSHVAGIHKKETKAFMPLNNVQATLTNGVHLRQTIAQNLRLYFQRALTLLINGQKIKLDTFIIKDCMDVL